MTEIDLGNPVYRIYKLDRFETLLRSGTDAVVNPRRWGDPFENFLLDRTVMIRPEAVPVALSTLADDWYGQCWSLNPESDAMWRIYSPQPDEKRGAKVKCLIGHICCPDPPTKIPGVKVKSTIGRIFENLRRAGSPFPLHQFFVGRVLYRDEAGIAEIVKGMMLGRLAGDGLGVAMAESLCVKREAFEHEKEVRVLFRDSAPGVARHGDGEAFVFPLAAADVFDEVVLDPRLDDADTQAASDRIRAAGWTGRLRQSTLYRAPSFTIPPR